MKHDPDLRVQVAALPRPGDLQQSARADRIGLLSGLLRRKEGAAERRLGVDRASVVFQNVTCSKTWRNAPQLLPLGKRQLMLPLGG